MATLSIQALQVTLVWATASAGGDEFTNDGENHLLAWNTSGVDLRVRFETQTQPSDPFIAAPDLDVTIAAGSIVITHAVPPKWFNNAGGKVQVTYPDGVTDLSVAAVAIPAAARY